ncbi:MAG TPA: zinc-binding alcohol dehydrogenase family protein [Candidatus Binatia bacterium]|nr:zinc-binding alcohol dehydrogenase family protein [Candidatus Binatia bacterium]
MQAVVCRQPGEVALEERPDPVRGESEVLVGVRRIGLCGTDFHIFEGSHPYLAYPRIIGHEFSGEVLEVPAGSALRRGETVVVNPYVSCGTCIACRNGKPNCCVRIAVLGVHRDGGCCERISVPAGNLYPARGLTVDQAASCEFLAIGAHAVARAAVKPGQRTLVIGAGPIGLGAALFAGIAGADVSIMDRDAARLAFARENAIALRSVDAGPRTDAEVAEITQGEGFDLVFDATGNRASMEGAFRHVAHGGALVLVSIVSDNITFSDPEFHKREMTVMGSRNATRADFECVIAAIESGRVPLDRLITHRTSLGGTVLDLPRWTTEKAGLVKALVEIG